MHPATYPRARTRRLTALGRATNAGASLAAAATTPAGTAATPLATAVAPAGTAVAVAVAAAVAAVRRACTVIAAAALAAACAVVPKPADVVLTGGWIWTGVEGAAPATALAIRDGRILHVGTDTEVARMTGPRTRVIALDGQMVVPGFADDHAHFMSGGFQLGSVDLRDAASPAEFARRIGEFARDLPAGRWVTGGDWDHELWDGAPLPRREWIDSLTGGTPVFVNRLDGHMALANTVALDIAGITRDTPDPDGGTIVRDPETGEPTGVLKDDAMDLVAAHIPEPTMAERDEAFRRAQRHALSHGVTLVNAMGSWDDLETYRRARRRGDLVVRIYAFVPIESWQRLRDYIAREGTGDARLRWGGVKGFVDGSLGSTTAWFYEPYDDAPETRGLLTTDTASLRAWIHGADAADLQVAVHAIGDRANDWLLGVYADLVASNGRRFGRRVRVEHAQHLTRQAIARFAELGVIPSMQPYHAIDDGRWAEKRIGPARVRTTYAFRDLIDAGAALTFGSDWTVAPIDPLLGIYAAATRRTTDGLNPDGWVPAQKITVEEALRAYTARNAYASYLETQLGTLEPEKHADLVVLSENLLEIDPARIPEVRVEMTMIDGVVVYDRQARYAGR